ncbi:MAG: hypothetical protein H7A45_09980 [Verrucomicrobiales bacterium]|nr:hypothetical protein [Verrucomicrobiales bacterium]
MLYIDTSSLLKTLWEEAESPAVRQVISLEAMVVVSSLTELEVEVQLQAGWLGGRFSQARYRKYRSVFASLRGLAPFEFRELPGTVFRQAIDRLTADGRLHCRTLNRLHLAAMAELGLHRLMTHDVKQAATARAQGCEVLSPGMA